MLTPFQVITYPPEQKTAEPSQGNQNEKNKTIPTAATVQSTNCWERTRGALNTARIQNEIRAPAQPGRARAPPPPPRGLVTSVLSTLSCMNRLGLTGRPTFHGRVGVWAVGENHIHIVQLQSLQRSLQSWERSGRGQHCLCLAQGRESEEARTLSRGALGQVRVLRRCQDSRHSLKGVGGTLAIPEDIRRTTGQMS